MKFLVTQRTPYDPQPVSLRCPHCGKEAAMPGIGVHDIDVGNGIWCGQRVCPNAECRGHVFVVQRQGKVLASYPPATIDFNPDGIPQNIVASIDEALRCHSIGCFTAAALLVRRRRRHHEL